MTYKEDVMNHQHRKPRIRLRLVFNLHDVAIGIGLLFCLDKILVCNGQKPINLGGVKRRDVYIAGFFPYGRHVPESHIGRGVMPSVKLAVDHINDNPTILRNYRLHMWWNDTECNAAVGVKAFFDMMHSGPHKLMLFGAACTQVTDPIAKASKHWRLTQLSYADTHPMFTSDNFPNFFRIVPSENAFNAPRVALLNHFNWTRVGTLYQNEPRYALAHNRLVADLDDNKMEVVEAQSFATEVTAALDKLKRKDVRIILGNFNEIWARKIFCEAYRYKMFGRKYQWVIMGTYTEKWWLETDGGCETAELIEALHGAILTDLLPLSTERQITISGITPDEYQIEYDSRRGNEYSRFHGYTYDGIWAVALAVQHVARRIRHFRRNQTVADFKYRDPLWENLFLEALKNTSFEGVTGPVRFYDNERKAYILLKQFQNGSEVKVGEYDGVTGTLDLSRGQSLIWRGRAPPKDRTVHVIEPSTVNITIYSIIATAASIGIIMAAVFLAINIKHRNQRYIKMSSPHLNNLIIVGCMLTYSSVIFLGLDSTLSSVTAFPYICTARAWLLMAGFSLAFGAMFSKTWRVHSIFTDVKLNKKVIKDYQLFMVVGVLLVIDLAIMTTWQVADPFYRETKQMEPYPHPSSDDIVMIPENEYCQSERMTLYLGGIYAYKGLLMIFGAFLAWETRHVSIPALNDSKYVGMSVYNVVIMCVTGAAISFVLADKQDTMFIMLSIFIIFCSTGTLCLVFVPKLIELRRNPQGAIDKRIRATLRPSSKTRRDSVVSELEERLKEATKANQKFRKELIEKDAEIELYMRRLGDSSVENNDETIRKISIPQNQETLIKKEGPSMMTETTDISISLCSLTSTTAATQPEGEYVNVMSMHNQQSITGKTPFATKSSDGIECSSLLPTANNSTKNDKYQMNHGGECQEKEPLIKANLETEGALCDSGMTKRNIEIASIETTIEESEESIVLEETDIIPYVTGNKLKLKEKAVITDGEKSQRRLPTPPPSKNVSFGELQEQCYLEQAILPPPVQFIPKHRHQVHHQALTKRKGSVKNNGLAHSHHQLLEKRRTSVPTNTISYISTDNVSKTEAVDGKFDHSHVVTECTHRRGTNLSGSTGYRCEKHGGGLAAVRGTHVHTTASGAANGSVEISRKHRDPGTILSYSDTEKQDMSGEGMIQRSVSEKSREKYFHTRSNFDRRITECRHRTASRKHRECRHMESKLRQQARLEYVQSTPNVATIHNSKFASTNPRSGRGVGGGGCGGTGRGVSGSGSAIGGSDDTGGGGCGNGVDNRRCDNGVEIRGSYNKSDSSMVSSGKTAIDVNGSGTSVTVSGSTVDISHMYSAVSDGELLDLEILPIFQKLLTERHKTTARGSYGANIASCPNISIKCDIVEYL